MEQEFFNQFSGSASANVVTVALVGILMLLKKCLEQKSNYQHSKCTSCCLSVELDKDDEDSDEGRVEKEVETRVREMLRSYRNDVRSQHLSVIPPGAPRKGPNPVVIDVAKSPRIAKKIRFPEVVSPARAVPGSDQGGPGVPW